MSQREIREAARGRAVGAVEDRREKSEVFTGRHGGFPQLARTNVMQVTPPPHIELELQRVRV